MVGGGDLTNNVLMLDNEGARDALHDEDARAQMKSVDRLDWVGGG